MITASGMDFIRMIGIMGATAGMAGEVAVGAIADDIRVARLPIAK